MTFREAEKMIKSDGWRFDRAKGSHYQYKHPKKPGTVTIPYHKGDLKIEDIKSIEKQSGLKLR